MHGPGQTKTPLAPSTAWKSDWWKTSGAVLLLLAVMPRGAEAARATAIAANVEHRCAITRAGGLLCWGRNGRGQLGDGTTRDRAVPGAVGGLTTGVIAVITGEGHTCALTAGGGVKCWGDNTDGQLGDGTTVPRLTPVDVSGLTSGVIALSAGRWHSCALLSTGAARCWGRNIEGALGDGTTTSRSSPVDVAGLTSGVAQIAAGTWHTCAVTTGGAVKCWGLNYDGQLGDGTTTWHRLTPVDVVGLGSGVASVALGASHTCALSTAGGVRCWGADHSGQLGQGGHFQDPGRIFRVTTPLQVAGLSNGVVALDAGSLSNCAVLDGGAVKCWGGLFGSPGDALRTPAQVNGLRAPVTALGVSDGYACAVTVAGGVLCWGNWGQEGLGAGALGFGTFSSDVPLEVAGLQEPGARSLVSGSEQSCLLTAEGGVKCWGRNDGWELGDGSGVTRHEPGEPSGLSSGAVAIAAGPRDGFAVMNGGSLKCWGTKYESLGTTAWARPTPTDLPDLGSGVATVAAGMFHTCALTTSGGIKCWGDNLDGQLGDGTSVGFRDSPVDVVGLGSAVAQIAAGTSHTCGVAPDGGVRCWGRNETGQLGDGTQVLRRTPVAVAGLTGVVAVALGSVHSCALTVSGAVKCWGGNSVGQLGDGTITPRATPVDVAGLSTGVVAIAAGSDHSCAILADGRVMCWGQMGLAGATDLLPREVPGVAGAIVVSAGYAHSCALLDTGRVRCWGDNSNDQLGMRRPETVRLTPFAVPAFGYVPDFNGDGRPDVVWRDRRTGELVFWLMNGTTVTSEVRTAGPADPNWRIAAVADFDRDEQADLVFRHAETGENQIWYMNGTTQRDTASMPAVSDPAWKLAAAADINSDGFPDLVWRHALSGDNVIWFMRGPTRAWYTHLPPVTDRQWEVAGAADFDDDGAPELLWRRPATGESVLWRIEWGGYAGYTRLPDEDPARVVAGTGDVDGDGRADIIWTNLLTGDGIVRYSDTRPGLSEAISRTADSNWDPVSMAGGIRSVPVDFDHDGRSDVVWRNVVTGEDRIWSMDGATRASETALPSQAGAGWRIAGHGDFDADGQVDLVWRNGVTGENKIWLMNGTTVARETLLPTVSDGTWRIVGVGDFTGDAQADLVWRSTAYPDTVLWPLTDGQYGGYVRLPGVSDSNAHIVGVGDFNEDGKADLVWRNEVTGENAIWYMDGPTLVGSASFRSVPEPEWRIVAVADYNGDGRPDLFWRNSVSGQNVIWFMNGAAFLGYAHATSEPDLNWTVGPGY